MIYPLLAGAKATESEIGGKGYNLIQMLDAGICVPGGFVLGVTFFASWFETLKALPEWGAFLEASEEQLEKACHALKSCCKALSFHEEQKSALASFTEQYTEEALFAVRSSSPEEDLEGSSFAGAYESVLGVKLGTLEEAVKKAFSSCLDVRIAVYKKQKGFAIDSPKIAVVVQKQIASEVAGVGFSINPLNNDHDQAVFNANWGQGETVVAGLASPDYFVVEKHSLGIQERVVGGKETSIWLKPEGGTEERQDERFQELCLTDEQVLELTRQLMRIEAFYQKPMDIEWAFEKGQLHLVQARPITTHLHIPTNMKTPSGAPKSLYLDVTISVQGLFDPLTPMGIALFDYLAPACRYEMYGGKKSDIPADKSLPVFGGGRVYANITNLIGLVGKERVTRLFYQMDPLASAAIQNVNFDAFQKPKISKARIILGILSRIFPRVRNAFRAITKPEKARQRWQNKWDLYRKNLELLGKRNLSPEKFFSAAIERMVPFVLRETVVLFGSAKISLSKIHKLFPEPTPEVARHLEALDQSLPGNVTVEMGLALYRLSQHLTPEEAPDQETLRHNIDEGKVSFAFKSAWNEFLEAYGHRGPKELDIASPRFREEPGLLLQQLVSFLDPEQATHSPLAMFEASQKKRREAYDFLCAHLEKKSKRKMKRFQRFYQVVETLGGFRETHKFVVIYTLDQVRKQVLQVAESWAATGRIEKAADIFYLHYRQVDKGLEKLELELLQMVEEGKKRTLQADQCKQIFPIMDSRGRFHLPPPPKVRPGEIAGQAVSTGIVRGNIKILHAPDEKPLLPGEILVARATDPGWTPLFVNAAGIILEVGGPLQHGALVAREYGKPCVSGIMGATSLFQDGEPVELDGISGIIRRLNLLESRTSTNTES